MAEKYYWIKLRNTFLTSRAVDFLMSQPNGANYVVLYQCLCLNTINTNGELSTTIGEIIVPYDIAKIQRDSKWFSEDTVRVALALYEKLGLVYTQENGILKISDFDRMVGDETKWAEYKRLEREKAKTLIGQCPTNVQQDIRDKSLILLDTKKEEENKEYGGKPTTSHKQNSFIKPTIEEIKSYNSEIDADAFWNFYESKGWLIGKSKMVNWHSAVANWLKRDKETAKPKYQTRDEKMKEDASKITLDKSKGWRGIEI